MSKEESLLEWVLDNFEIIYSLDHNENTIRMWQKDNWMNTGYPEEMTTKEVIEAFNKRK